jgi:hypothetical protein
VARWGRQRPWQAGGTLSPLRYHYRHRAEVEAVVQTSTGRDASFATMLCDLDRPPRLLCSVMKLKPERSSRFQVEDGPAALRTCLEDHSKHPEVGANSAVP